MNMAEEGFTRFEENALPREQDVIAVLDAHPGGVSVEAILKHLLDKRDHVDRGVAESFAERVHLIVISLVEQRRAEWVLGPSANLLRRSLSAVAIGDVALAFGEDPEVAIVRQLGGEPRYRKGPCYFWRSTTWTSVYSIATVIAGNPHYPHYSIHTVVVSAGKPSLLEAGFRFHTGKPHAEDEPVVCDRVPEHYARRLEQDGWIPFWPDMPPAWAETSISQPTNGVPS